MFSSKIFFEIDGGSFLLKFHFYAYSPIIFWNFIQILLIKIDIYSLEYIHSLSIYLLKFFENFREN